MRKLLRKMTAIWLAAFAIAGATVWAGAQDEPPKAGAASTATGRTATQAHREAEDQKGL